MSECYCNANNIGANYLYAQESSAYAGAAVEIQTSPTDYLRVLQIGLRFIEWGVGGVTPMVAGVGIPAVKGVGRGGSTLNYVDSGNTSGIPNVSLYTDWLTVPTVPTQFFRRVTFNSSNVFQAEVKLNFPRGISVPPSSSLVVWITPIVIRLVLDPTVVLDA